MYSKKQLEYSEVILSTLFNNGGRMKESDVCDVLDEKYGEETIDPVLQIESLIHTEGMIVKDGAYLLLTEKGRKAGAKTMREYLRGKVRDERIERWTRYLNFGKAVWWLIGGLMGWFLRDGWNLMMSLLAEK